jgi:hypothetical protein
MKTSEIAVKTGMKSQNTAAYLRMMKTKRQIDHRRHGILDEWRKTQ